MIEIVLAAAAQLTDQQQASLSTPAAELAYKVCTLAKAVEYESEQKGETAATIAEAALGGCPKELAALNSLWFAATDYRDEAKVQRQLTLVKSDARQAALSYVMEMRSNNASDQ